MPDSKIDIAAGKRVYPDRRKYFVRKYGLAALFAVAVFSIGFFFLSIGEGWGATAAIACWAVATLVLAGTLSHTILHCNGTVIYLAQEEVVFETGILEHQKTSVPLHMITDIKLDQDMLDKLIGTGIIRINTSGSTGYEIEARFAYAQLEELHAELLRLIRKSPASVPDKEAKK